MFLNFSFTTKEPLLTPFVLFILYGSPNYSSVELFKPVINHIKEHFSETYEYIEDAYEAVFEWAMEDDE